MNKQQAATEQLWSEKVGGICTCSNFRPFGSSAVVCTEHFIYTVAISVLILECRVTRFCFRNYGEALSALNDWEAKGFAGKPEGYIKQKPEDDAQQRKGESQGV